MLHLLGNGIHGVVLVHAFSVQDVPPPLSGTFLSILVVLHIQPICEMYSRCVMQ